jgi:hypothetical protein
MSLDEIAEYRRKVEAKYTTRRKGIRALTGGRRAVDHKLPAFFDVPLAVMFLILVVIGAVLMIVE